MRHLVAKLMISLACAIIMLHAVVPHHHHDCSDAKGFVFETEVACHCECDHHECDHRHSHHPFNTCWLEEMLSHLVISTYDETNYVAYIQAEAHNSFILTVPPVVDDMCTLAVTGGQSWWSRITVPLVKAPVMGALSSRAPPYVS